MHEAYHESINHKAAFLGSTKLEASAVVHGSSRTWDKLFVLVCVPLYSHGCTRMSNEPKVPTR